MPIVSGYDPIVIQIADALGLESKQIKRLKIDFSAEEAVIVKVSYYPTKEQVEEVSKYFNLCRLEELSE